MSFASGLRNLLLVRVHEAEIGLLIVKHFI